MLEFQIIAGSSNTSLAQSIADHLHKQLIPLEIEEFINGEKRIIILGDIKDEMVYIIQSFNPNPDIYIIETLLIADALKRKGAEKVGAIIPWLGYSPQDKIFRDGEPLSSEVVIKVLETYIDSFIVVDLHSKLVEKMFTKKVKHLFNNSINVDYLKNNLHINKSDFAVVALDKGSLEKAEYFATKLKLPLLKFDKSRDRATGEITFQKLEGDPAGKKLLAFDDFVSTGSTLVKAAKHLKSLGANSFYSIVTHIIVPEKLDFVLNSDIDLLITTNSVDFDFSHAKLVKLDLGEFIANNIK